MAEIKVVQESGWKRFFVSLLGGFIAGCVTWAMTLGIFVFFIFFILSLASSKPISYDETVLVEGDRATRIAVINIKGVIVSEDDFDPGAPNANTSAARVVGQLKQAEKDATVKAIVLKVNSPGGGVVPSAQIYEKVVNVNKSKKVYAVFEDTAASGGYYVSAPVSRIFTDKHSFTGSIGVIIEIPEISGLLDKVGVTFNVYKSGEHKDIGSPYRPQDAEEKKILQSLVDEAFVDFSTAVKEGRKLTASEFAKVSDGRVISGKEAVELKLADAVGDLEDAVNYASSEAGVTGAEVFEFAAPGFLESITSVKKSLFKLMSGTAELKPRLMFLWVPA